MFLSSDDGNFWITAGSGLTNYSVKALAVCGSDIFAGTNGNGIFITTDNGSSWTPVNNGLANSYVRALAVSGSNIFAGTRDGVFLSTTNGSNWTSVSSGLGSLSSDVGALIVTPSGIFAGTDGVYRSTNNGTNWIAAKSGLPLMSSFTAFAFYGSRIFVAAYNNGVYLSTNNGSNWSSVKTGLTNFEISSLAVNGTNLLTGTNGSGVWIRPLSEMTSAKELQPGMIPGFSLSQNYPNPFNPSTTISFNLKENSSVTIDIYNVPGNRVRQLNFGQLNPGTYSRSIDMSQLAGGIYFCTIHAYSSGGKQLFSDTKKMILLK